MSKEQAALASMVAMVGLAAAGCSKPNRTAEGPIRLSPNPAPYFRDIPIPSGFTRVNERSTYLVSGQIRLVKHVFVGKAGLLAVRDFYCEQMPVGRWREVNRQFEEGLLTLRFEKGNEGCKIKFRRRNRILWRETEISVEVMPRNLTEAPPTVKASTAE